MGCGGWRPPRRPPPAPGPRQAVGGRRHPPRSAPHGSGRAHSGPADEHRADARRGVTGEGQHRVREQRRGFRQIFTGLPVRRLRQVDQVYRVGERAAGDLQLHEDVELEDTVETHGGLPEYEGRGPLTSLWRSPPPPAPVLVELGGEVLLARPASRSVIFGQQERQEADPRAARHRATLAGPRAHVGPRRRREQLGHAACPCRQLGRSLPGEGLDRTLDSPARHGAQVSVRRLASGSPA